jgi:hypothetical protein
MTYVFMGIIAGDVYGRDVNDCTLNKKTGIGTW